MPPESMQNWSSAEVDISKPNVARIYDYLLGGYHNFDADRQLAEQMMKVFPDAKVNSFINRAFLHRAVRFMAEQGIRQFLDIGAGIPTMENTHEVAAKIIPDVRVVYTDIDSIAIAHSKTILHDNPNVGAFWADAADIEVILEHPITKRLIDFSQPVGILLISVVHYITDDEKATRMIDKLKAVMASGSCMAITHSTLEGYQTESTEEADRLLKLAASTRHRTRVEIKQFFEGLEIVSPGVVFSQLWRLDTDEIPFENQPWRAIGYSGIGRKV